MTSRRRSDELEHVFPFSAAQSRRQIRSLLRLVGSQPKTILDLGCGEGRVLLPLAKAGHVVTGMDHRADAIAACQHTLARHRIAARLIKADFRKSFNLRSRFDAVVCLGNTLMTVAEVSEATELFSRIANVLEPGGCLVIDDMPRDFWPELTGGRWQNGIGANGQWQMVWKPGDAVFALRRGSRVKRRQWNLTAADVPLRLWCDGSLKLLAQTAGLSGPERPRNGELLVFRDRLESRHSSRRGSR